MDNALFFLTNKKKQDVPELQKWRAKLSDSLSRAILIT